MQKRAINPNLALLVKACSEQCYNDDEELIAGRRGVVLEGGSRSGKTWAWIDFIIWICTNVETNCTINIIRDTYNSFKTTIYNDLKQRLSDYNLENPFLDKKEVKSFKIFGNTINLLGADKVSTFLGAQCDYAIFNEANNIQKEIFDQQEQRCKKFWVSDYNPSSTFHYIYNNIIPRDDVGFLRTTLLANPFVSIQEKKKILSYEPTAFNIKQGTADDHLWRCYGLGLRSSPRGLVFPNIIWIDKLPVDLDNLGYGLDFGYTNDPLSFSIHGTKGKNMYSENLIYEPIENADLIIEMFERLGVERHLPIYADNADNTTIAELCDAGYNVFGLKKLRVKQGIAQVKNYKQHFVINNNIKKEQENYKYREINGKQLEEPIDKFNHFFDDLRYYTYGITQENQGYKIY